MENNPNPIDSETKRAEFEKLLKEQRMKKWKYNKY